MEGSNRVNKTSNKQPESARPARGGVLMHFIRARRGAVAIEFALGLPIYATYALVIPDPAAAQDATQDRERIAVRVGEHPGFTRIVFDWPQPVGTRLEQSAGKTILPRMQQPPDSILS